MKFKLGDIVEYVPKHSSAGLVSTVIGIDPREGDQGGAVLIGWKIEEDTGLRRPPALPKVQLISTDLLSDNYKEYAFACWEDTKNLQHANPKGYTRVRRRTLLKRMRDQIAQEIYKE